MAPRRPQVQPGPGSGNDGDNDGGSSSSSSSSSASAGPSKEQLAAVESAYRAILEAWQIPITPDVKRFIAKAAKEGMSSTQFMQKFRRTKVYAQRFKGILRGDGSMRMTEAQYLSGYNSARDFAGSVGRGLSREQYAMGIKMGNSPSEMKAKIEALDIMKQQKDVFNEFNEYLIARGKVGPKGVSKKEMAQFVMKQGPAEWEKEWRTAYTASLIERANINVGKPEGGSDLGFRKLDRLLREAGPNFDPATLDWQRLSELAREVIPLSKWQGVGISKTDLVSEAVGAKTAARVAAEIKRVMGTHLAAQEATANTALSAGPRGTQQYQGNAPVQATE